MLESMAGMSTSTSTYANSKVDANYKVTTTALTAANSKANTYSNALSNAGTTSTFRNADPIKTFRDAADLIACSSSASSPASSTHTSPTSSAHSSPHLSAIAAPSFSELAIDVPASKKSQKRQRLKSEEFEEHTPDRGLYSRCVEMPRINLEKAEAEARPGTGAHTQSTKAFEWLVLLAGLEKDPTPSETDHCSTLAALGMSCPPAWAHLESQPPYLLRRG